MKYFFRYENGGFDSSFTPAQIQQIRRISFAQVLCRTLDSIETVQPFVFLSTDNPDNDRISCQNGLLNNFDLSPWIEIDSESDNDISKSEETTTRPIRKSTTTTKPTTTKKTEPKGASKPSKKKPDNNSNAIKNMTIENLIKENQTDKLNATELKKDNDSDELNLTLTNDVTSTTAKPNMTTKPAVTRRDVQIDDKLDFKNKSRRFDDFKVDSRRRPSNKYDEYDYEDDEDTHQVQSVVINNVAHTRPYSRPNNRPSNRPNNRPVITVTENIDKYTYLINYVPRPTESWRQSTRRHTTGRPMTDRDVVKVTYQTYDDTYRRPNKPYYYNNRQDDPPTNYRYNRPTHTTKYNYPSSARSNDETVTDKTETKTESTTDLYKLVTFGYVGTYKGEASTTEKKITDSTDKTKTVMDVTDKDETAKDMTDKEVTERHKAETVSKDFSTFDANDNENKNMKLSTFYVYETATKPYLQRPTRRNDEMPIQTNKYYYIRNVLHKYSDTDKSTPKPTNKEEKREVYADNNNNPGNQEVNIEERSAIDKMASLDDVEAKSKGEDRHRNRVKPSSPAKTPSVAFQVIPSENR